MIIVVESSIEWLPVKDPLGAQEVIIGLTKLSVIVGDSQLEQDTPTYRGEEEVVVGEPQVVHWCESKGFPLRIDKRLISGFSFKKNRKNSSSSQSFYKSFTIVRAEPR